MPFTTRASNAFERDSIIAAAPHASGVYGIYRHKVWIHVGESEDIQRRLIQHLTTPGTVLQYHPTGFKFEVVPEEGERKARYEQLMRELQPRVDGHVG
jgi:excinuclease UvrABC nuclease subunit